MALSLLVVLGACGPIVQKGTPLAAVASSDRTVFGGPYKLQPGDQLEVHHVLDADYSAVVLVAPDGRINVPGIREPVMASDQTITELTDRLNQLYRKDNYLKEPFFSLNLRSFSNLQVFIGGEVQRPGYLEITGGNRTLLQVIVAGGGFMNTARQKEVIVIRTLPDGSNQIFTADMTKVISGEDLSQNVRIHPLDVVYVPKSNVASFDTWIDQYVRQALPVSTSASISYIPNNTNAVNSASTVK
jgi:polysaccharide export outer membrane protein